MGSGGCGWPFVLSGETKVTAQSPRMWKGLRSLQKHPPVRIITTPPHPNDFADMLETMNAHKAADECGLLPKFLKHVPEDVLTKLLALMNDLLFSGELPSTWQKTVLQMLPKTMSMSMSTLYVPLGSLFQAQRENCETTSYMHQRLQNSKNSGRFERQTSTSVAEIAHEDKILWQKFAIIVSRQYFGRPMRLCPRGCQPSQNPLDPLMPWYCCERLCQIPVVS